MIASISQAVFCETATSGPLQSHYRKNIIAVLKKSPTFLDLPSVHHFRCHFSNSKTKIECTFTIFLGDQKLQHAIPECLFYPGVKNKETFPNLLYFAWTNSLQKWKVQCGMPVPFHGQPKLAVKISLWNVIISLSFSLSCLLQINTEKWYLKLSQMW